mgnify:CR=1 FL=1
MNKDPQLKKIYQLLKKEQAEIKKSVTDKMFTLATSAFGLVAALAWNDAIKAFFEIYFPTQDQLFAKIWYALIVTTLAVVITYYLGKFSGKDKEPKPKN